MCKALGWVGVGVKPIRACLCLCVLPFHWNRCRWPGKQGGSEFGQGAFPVAAAAAEETKAASLPQSLAEFKALMSEEAAAWLNAMGWTIEPVSAFMFIMMVLAAFSLAPRTSRFSFQAHLTTFRNLLDPSCSSILVGRV